MRIVARQFPHSPFVIPSRSLGPIGDFAELALELLELALELFEPTRPAGLLLLLLLPSLVLLLRCLELEVFDLFAGLLPLKGVFARDCM